MKVMYFFHFLELPSVYGNRISHNIYYLKRALWWLWDRHVVCHTSLPPSLSLFVLPCGPGRENRLALGSRWRRQWQSWWSCEPSAARSWATVPMTVSCGLAAELEGGRKQQQHARRRVQGQHLWWHHVRRHAGDLRLGPHEIGYQLHQGRQGHPDLWLSSAWLMMMKLQIKHSSNCLDDGGVACLAHVHGHVLPGKFHLNSLSAFTFFRFSSVIFLITQWKRTKKVFSQSVQNKRVAPFVDNSVNCTARGEKCSASLNNVACILMVLFRTLLCCWKESIEYVIRKIIMNLLYPL